MVEENLSDLSLPGFIEWVGEVIGGRDAYALVAVNKAFPSRARCPIGLIVVLRRNKRTVEPHVVWMPWATSRNKIETIVQFLDDMRRGQTVLILSRPDTRPFWSHLRRYAVLNFKATIDRYYEDEENAQVWQTR